MNRYSFAKIIFLLATCILTIGSANAELFIHKLNHQLAANVIPVIKPHLTTQTTMTAKDYQLFVNGSKKDNDKVVSLLQMIDIRAREYNIEVKILDHKMDNNQLRHYQISKNDQSNSSESSKTEVRRYKTQSTNQKNHQFILKTIENYPAYVSTGESFPTNQIQSQYGHLLPSSGRTKITSGFYLTVQHQGDQQVLLSLSAHQQQRQSRYGQGVSSSSTSTKVKGELGRWILATSTTTGSKSNGSRHYRTDSNRNKQRWYYIRVNETK